VRGQVRNVEKNFVPIEAPKPEFSSALRILGSISGAKRAISKSLDKINNTLLRSDKSDRNKGVLGGRKYIFPLEKYIFCPLSTSLRGGAAAEKFTVT